MHGGRRRNLLVVGAALTLAGAASTCGGTTGHEDLPQTTDPSDATLDPDAGSGDAGSQVDTGAFDVVIQYADRMLPDIVAPPPMDASVGDASEFPNCPPWLPLDSNYNILDAAALATALSSAGSPAYWAPAAYAADGGIEEIFTPTSAGIGWDPDASACTAYPWYQGVDLVCMMNKNPTYVDPVPPCNWVLEAGVATRGPGAAQSLSLYSLCIAAYNCIENSGCGVPNVVSCLCGNSDAGNTACLANPDGPCAPALQEAFQEPDLSVASVQDMLENFNGVSGVYLTAGPLLSFHSNALSQKCFVDSGSP